jgi:hypothetical protein
MHACALQIGPCSPVLLRIKQKARACECMNGASEESQPDLTEAQRYELAARAAEIKFQETGKLPKNISLTPSGSFLVQVCVGGKQKRPRVKTLYEAVRERDRLKAEQQAQKHALPYEKRKALEEEFDKFCDDSIHSNNEDNNDDYIDYETAYVEACADGTFCVRVRVLKDEHSDACDVLGGRHDAQDEARTQLQKLKLVQRYRSEARKARKAFDETKTLPENITLNHGSFQVHVKIAGENNRSTFYTLYDAIRKRDMLKFEQQAIQTNHSDEKKRIFKEEWEKYDEAKDSGIVHVNHDALTFCACIYKDKGKYPPGPTRQLIEKARADAKKILNGEEVEKHVKATGPNGEPLPRNVRYDDKTQKYQTTATVGEARPKWVGSFLTVEEAVKERDCKEKAAYDLISPVESTRCCEPCKIAFVSNKALRCHEQQTHNGGGTRLCADETCNNKAICHSTFCSQHTEERPFVCEEEGCTKRFKTKSELNQHMKTHNGELQNPCKGTNHIDGRYCPFKVSGSYKYDGLCQRCFCNAFPNDPRTKKAKMFTHAKERMVRERLEDAFPGYRWTFDRTYATGVLFRPDAKAVTKTVTVIVEIDEFSHKLRECAREREREEIFQKHAPKNNVVFVIRFNPDGYTDPETLVKVPSCFKFNKATALVQVPKTREADWNRRLDKLCATVQEIFDHQSTAEPASNYVLEHMENYEKYKHVNMIELFYDTVNERMRKEQEEAKKNAAEDEARRAQYHANQKRKREDLEEDSDEDLDEDSDEDM